MNIIDAIVNLIQIQASSFRTTKKETKGSMNPLYPDKNIFPEIQFFTEDGQIFWKSLKHHYLNITSSETFIDLGIILDLTFIACYVVSVLLIIDGHVVTYSCLPWVLRHFVSYQIIFCVIWVISLSIFQMMLAQTKCVQLKSWHEGHIESFGSDRTATLRKCRDCFLMIIV